MLFDPSAHILNLEKQRANGVKFERKNTGGSIAKLDEARMKFEWERIITIRDRANF